MSAVSQLFIMIDEDNEEEAVKNLMAVQIWEDGLMQRTDIAEIIIIMANRSTCPGRANDGGYVFSYMGSPPEEREFKVSSS